MTTTTLNGNAPSAPSQTGLVPTIERYRQLQAEQRKLEAAARKLKKQADTLEAAIADQVEQSGGMLEAGPYVLGFEFQDGSKYPPYKQICEQVVAEYQLPADVISRKVAALPPRRKLVIA